MTPVLKRGSQGLNVQWALYAEMFELVRESTPPTQVLSVVAHLNFSGIQMQMQARCCGTYSCSVLVM